MKHKESKADLIFSLSLFHSTKSKEISDIFIPYDRLEIEFDYAYFTDPLIENLLSKLEEAKNDKQANKIIQRPDNRRKVATIIYATQFNDNVTSIIKPFCMLADVLGIKNNDGIFSFNNINLEKAIRDSIAQREFVKALDDFLKIDEVYKENFEKNQMYFDKIFDDDQRHNPEDLDRYYTKSKDEPEKYYVRIVDAVELEDDEQDNTSSCAYMLDAEIFSDIEILKKEAKEILDDIKNNPNCNAHKDFYTYLNQDKPAQFINTIIEDLNGLSFFKDTRLRLISDVYDIRDSTNVILDYPFKYEGLNGNDLYKNRIRDISFVNQNQREINSILGLKEEKEYPEESYCKLAVSYTVSSHINLNEFQKNLKEICNRRPESELYYDDDMEVILDEFINKIKEAQEDQDNYEDDALPLSEIVYALNRNLYALTPFDYEGKLLPAVGEILETFKEALNTHNQSFDNWIFKDATQLISKIKNAVLSERESDRNMLFLPEAKKDITQESKDPLAGIKYTRRPDGYEGGFKGHPPEM